VIIVFNSGLFTLYLIRNSSFYLLIRFRACLTHDRAGTPPLPWAHLEISSEPVCDIAFRTRGTLAGDAVWTGRRHLQPS
jgi:hypothetical protein